MTIIFQKKSEKVWQKKTNAPETGKNKPGFSLTHSIFAENPKKTNDSLEIKKYGTFDWA